MIYCLNTSRRIEAATRLNWRFSKSRLMLCSPRIKGSWLYSGCSTWVLRSTALTISSSSGDWTYHSALMKMHSNGSSLTSQVGDNTYAINGRTSEISVVECGVPQGSVLGPLYFVLFTADVFGIADEHGFAIHGYADDMQIYDHCVVDDMHHLTSRLVDCIGSIGVWMTNNRLKLNASKTEFIWFGSARRLAMCTFESIVINGSSILPSKTVRNLGVFLDPSLSLASHVTKLTSTLYFHIRQLRTIRWTLTNDACHALVRALVLSRLEYCNGLLAKAPDYHLAQLSGVMRAAARLILQLPRQSHVSDAIRRQLHWLDISERVRFKLCVLARRCIHGSAPSYLSKYCIPVSSIAGRSHLRFAASGDLFIPATNTVTIGPRAFAVACPAAWNSLPPELHDKSMSLMTFRKKLKTYLFKIH